LGREYLEIFDDRRLDSRHENARLLEMTKEVIVRIPPSPTGRLHLGTARTALFNYLFAKKHDGKMIFRWEDTDQERSKTEHETEILEGLKWLGMDFEAEASFERQTEWLDRHKSHLQNLWKAGSVFPCFVTSDEIQVQREAAQKARQNFVFWSPFRDLDRDEAEAKMAAGTPFAWRLKVPKDTDINVIDIVRGEMTVSSNTIGDFVVARSDGSVLYMLANVLDDWQQGVTHIIRGEDHISNTPKQILVWQALKIAPPAYAHIPLVLDKNKKKLSKRKSDPAVCVLVPDFQAQGFLPEAVVNGLAFLGWNPKTEEEIFDMEGLIKRFDLTQVNPAAAQYDFEKMRWYNQQWCKKAEISELRDAFLDWTKEYEVDHLNIYNADHEKLDKILNIVREKAKVFGEFSADMGYFYSTPELRWDLMEKEKMKLDKELAIKVLGEVSQMLKNCPEDKFEAAHIRELSIEKIAEMGLKNGQFLSPFRVALSGLERSAGPFEIVAVLGKQQSLERIESYL